MPAITKAILASPNNTTGIGIIPTIPANTAVTAPIVPSTPITADIPNILVISKLNLDITLTANNIADIPAIIIAIFARPLTTFATGILPTVPAKTDNVAPTIPKTAIALVTFRNDLKSDSLAM